MEVVSLQPQLLLQDQVVLLSQLVLGVVVGILLLLLLTEGIVRLLSLQEQ